MSEDPVDGPNFIRFVIAEGGLGKIPGKSRLVKSGFNKRGLTGIKEMNGVSMPIPYYPYHMRQVRT